MTFRQDQPEKLCRTCYAKRFPDQLARTVTWGRECTQCHTPTPSQTTLIKVERRQEVS